MVQPRPSRPARLLSRLALLLLLVLTATTGLLAVPAPPASADFASAVLGEAARHQGKPYQWGATGPGSFDCSGFTGYVYSRFGVSLPRTADQQYAALPKVAQGAQVPGDLIFTFDGGGIYHVGIYAGNNQMWAAPKAGDVVRLQTIWTNQYKVARPVPEVTRQHWVSLGGVASPLGNPVTGEVGTPGGSGRFTHFQAGSIYWTPPVGAREVHGGIRDVWSRLGWERSVLGFPTTDETGTPGGVGRFNHFQGGSIYWTPATGAHEVRGGIRDAWSRLGWERGPLGFPTTGERRAADGTGRSNGFQNGAVYFSPATGYKAVTGAIHQAWMAEGAEAGPLGYPTVEAHPVPGGTAVDFSGGTITLDSAGGTTVVRTG